MHLQIKQMCIINCTKQYVLTPRICWLILEPRMTQKAVDKMTNLINWLNLKKDDKRKRNTYSFYVVEECDVRNRHCLIDVYLLYCGLVIRLRLLAI